MRGEQKEKLLCNQLNRSFTFLIIQQIYCIFRHAVVFILYIQYRAYIIINRNRMQTLYD